MLILIRELYFFFALCQTRYTCQCTFYLFLCFYSGIYGSPKQLEIIFHPPTLDRNSHYFNILHVMQIKSKIFLVYVLYREILTLFCHTKAAIDGLRK